MSQEKYLVLGRYSINGTNVIGTTKIHGLKILQVPKKKKKN